MTDSIYAVQGKDCVVVMASMHHAQSIIRQKDDVDRVMELDNDKLWAYTGPPCDTRSFTEYITANMKLNEMRNGYAHSVGEVASFIRNDLAYKIRKGPAQVAYLFAGYDAETGPQLYWGDYLGSLSRVGKGAHGYAGLMCQGLMDKMWKKDMSEDELVGIMKKCIIEGKKRFLVVSNHYVIKVVDKNGIRTRYRAQADVTDDAAMA